MFRNYLKVAARNLLRHKTYSLINLVGLSVSMAVCLLIYQYVTTELSYDSFHAGRDSIYRVVPSLMDETGEWEPHAMSPMPLAPVLAEDFPEIEKFTRFVNTGEAVVKVGNNCFTERLLYADPDMLSMFSFPLIHGDAGSALDDKGSIVVTEAMAAKYFGDTNAMSKVVSIKLGGEFREFVVTGVAQNIPTNSTISFDFLLPYDVIVELWGPPFTTSWGAMVTRSYVQLIRGADPTFLDDKLGEFLKKRTNLPEERLAGIRTQLQPLTDIHLNPEIDNRYEPTTNPMYLYILSGVALMLLLVACFNFTNIAIGLSSMRLREVGVRKVLGAPRRRLIRQFLAESIFLSLLALIAAIAIAELSIPVFNYLADAHLESGQLLNWVTLPAMLLLLLVVALLSGAYPALYLSRLNPSQILKGSLRIGGANMFTRSLIVAQFAVSVFFIICTFYMANQMNFVKTSSLGFNNDHVLILTVGSRDGVEVIQRLRNAVEDHPSVGSIAGSRESLGREGDFAVTVVESDGIMTDTYLFAIDEDFIPILNMNMSEGRNLSKDFASDQGHAVIVNQAFVRKYGWDSAIGKTIQLSFPGLENNIGEIVGVVEDFHYLSLHAPIEPAVMFTPQDFSPRKILVRVSPADVSGTVAMLGDIWSEIAPDQPFQYYFLDDDFNRQYQSDERWGRIIVYSAIVAILISAIGLLGVTTLTLTRRTKEIGIRKVLGATVSGLIGQINREFVVLILISNLLAWPAAYYVMNRWMENFAYRADIGWFVYIFAAITSMIIAIGTTTVQAARVSRINPADSLRYE